MADRTYLSIGQVLDLLKREFPDLTISKIRFLESQGLLDPERTPSGYRKFYGADIDRLRFILTEQSEHYLPLKVIKGRLGVDPDAVPPPHPGPDADIADVGEERGDESAELPPLPRHLPARDEPARAERSDFDRDSPMPVSGLRPISRPDPVARPRDDDGRLALRRRDTHVPAPDAGPSRVVDVGSSGTDTDPVSVTFEELAAKSGLTPAQVTELERFGLVVGHRIAGSTYYDGDCLDVATLAAAFRGFGVEARHLRMYRTAVEREAGFFEQVVTPMLKQRNPQARRSAVETLVELSRLGQAMRAAMMHQALREYTGPT